MAEATAMAKGAARQVATVLKGRTGIYSTLAKEHGEISSLLEQALKTDRPEKREPLLTKIRIELVSHARAETRTFYEALGKLDETRDMAAHSKIEHEKIEDLLQEVAVSEAGSDQESAALWSLLEFVEHHAGEEEDVLFARANAALPRDIEAQLNEDFKREKQAEKRRLEGNGAGWSKGPVH